MQRTSLSLAIVLASIASQASAGGFALNEQSISAAGTANAGRVSAVLDASTVYNNPAAMMQLKQAQFTQAVAFIDAQSKITNVSGGLPGGTTEGDIVPHTFVPSGYYSSGDKGGWAWGVAAYGSFGLKTNYESTFAGRQYGDKSDVKVMTVQPTLSYQVTDVVSVGVGPTINKLTAFLSADPGTGTNVELEGDDLGYGYNIGVHAKLTEQTQVGLVYRSKVDYKITDGDIRNFPGVGSIKAQTKLTTPESIELGLSHQLTSATQIHAGAVWTRWSRLQSLNVTTPVPAISQAVSEDFEWKDVWGFATGVSHAYNDKLTVRAGLAVDQSPVTERHLSVRLPSGDRTIVSLGAGYKLTPNSTIDFSYTYLTEEKRNVNLPSDPPKAPFAATYKNTASIYGLQFTQRF